MLIIVYIIGVILLVQLFNLQIINGEKYRKESNTRLTRETTLEAARGEILDRTGKVELAVSASTETVSVNPTNIPSEKRGKLAEAMANIFDLDYEKVLKRLKRRTSIEIIIKNIIQKSQTYFCLCSCINIK